MQRYLLADEVGLGKTIEAGLIIRQHPPTTPTATSWCSPPRCCVDSGLPSYERSSWLTTSTEP